MLGCICVCLQQVDAAVVQQVGGALCSLLHHLVLVDDLHCLVVNAQPAVKTNVEDIRGVVTACCTVPMVIDNCKEPVSSLAFHNFAPHSRRQEIFADFQINRVINVLGQFLAASSLFKNKSLEMEHQHRGQLFQSHPPTDLNLLLGFRSVALD